MTFGECLKEKRMICKWTQKELSDKAGLTQAAICQYESDKRMPDLASFNKIISSMPWKAEEYLCHVK